MSLTREQAAQRLGMKPREIIAIAPAAGGGHLVTTHDGQQVPVDADGQVHTGGPRPAAPVDPEPSAAAPVTALLAEVPAGSIPDVLAWVGDDPERAQAAQAAESTKEKPRTGLVEALEKIRQAALGSGAEA